MDRLGVTTRLATGATALGDGPPPADARTELREIIARYPDPRSALLPMLHHVQSREGYVTPEGIETCAAELGLTTVEVAAVVTFYSMYKRRPVGDYHVGVCTNTLCAVMGGDEIFTVLQEHLGVGNDETTADGRVTLEHIECNAACDYAPVLMVNWEFFDNQTPQSARELVDRLRAGEDVHSTRGPRVCTWREAARVLAGFPDGGASEGPQAGPATLEGLRLAQEHGWTAPKPGERAEPADPARGADGTAPKPGERAEPADPARGADAQPDAPGQPEAQVASSDDETAAPAGRPHSGSDEPVSTAQSDPAATTAEPGEAGTSTPPREPELTGGGRHAATSADEEQP